MRDFSALKKSRQEIRAELEKLQKNEINPFRLQKLPIQPPSDPDSQTPVLPEQKNPRRQGEKAQKKNQSEPVPGPDREFR
ncbi:MAG TPA: hypothetical protein PL182_05750, partial [Pseudobdellovibrionaceae bacterium]|nr:hypothetical protein [Pseudobdellovibrionaceae bacterium]